MPHVVQFDCYEADLDSGELRKRGVRVGLREQSFQVLASLLEHPGHLITREELRRRLWCDEVFVDFDKNLNTAVARLRQALSDSADHPRFIETLPKRGYRFIGSAHPLPCAAAEETARRPRLIVLPFVNLSGDVTEEYFSDAMTDEIITALASVVPEHLAVIARTTAMQYKRRDKDVARIGRELNVDYVVEGGVRRSGDRVGINIQLIQTGDQTHLFARKYDTTLNDIFCVHDSIAQEVATCVAGKVHPAGAVAGCVRRKPTDDPVAYNLYLQGRYHMRQATPDGIATAKQYFEQALARDQLFALAYHALAEMQWWTGFQGFVRPKDAFSAGVFAALRTIEIDPTLAQAHALLGSYRKELDYNWPEVHREMSLALELDPDSTDVIFWYAGSDLMAQGHIQESIAELQRALELDPLSVLVRSSGLALVLYLGRLYEKAMEQVRLAMEIDPAYFFNFVWAGMIRCEEGAFDEAITVLRKAAQLSGDAPFALGWLGMALARSGDVAAAHKVLDQLHAMATQAYVLPTSFAWIHLGLGEIDQAYTWLGRAIDDRDPIIIPIKTYPFLDPLRNDSRFQYLLRKMNLEA